MATGTIKRKNDRWELLWTLPANTTNIMSSWLPLDLSEYETVKGKFTIYPYAENSISNQTYIRQIVYGKVHNWSTSTYIVFPNNCMFNTTSSGVWLYLMTKTMQARPTGIYFGNSWSMRSDNGVTNTAGDSRMIIEKIWGQRKII